MPFDGPSADEQLGPDLGIGTPVSGQPGDVLLLRGELVERVGPPLADLLPSREQFVPGSFRECLRTDSREEFVGSVELMARVDAPALATEPLSVDEMGAGELRTQWCASQPVDGLDVRLFGRR